MPSKFNSFRAKMETSEGCRLKYETAFIMEGTSATQIYHIRLGEEKAAALTISDKEGPDTSIVFTYKKADPEQELRKGDYFRWNGQTWFVYEDVALVREAAYIKQRAYQCNVYFTLGEDTVFGYYVSSLAKYVDTTLQSKINITDNDKPILILPQRDDIKVGIKIMVSNKPYKIIDIDRITNEGVMYLSLDRDFADKSPDIVVEEVITKVEEGVLAAGDTVTLATQSGVFKCSRQVEILEHVYDHVTFVVPFGVDTLTIIVADEDGSELETKYKVVL